MQAIRKRILVQDELLDAIEQWYDTEGVVWNKYRTKDQNKRHVDDDLYMLTELLILDIIGPEDE